VSGSEREIDDLPPREVLERLADLERRGLLTSEILASAAEVAKTLGLRIGEDVACGDRTPPLRRRSGPTARRRRRFDP
jgi:hypothetical protein